MALTSFEQIPYPDEDEDPFYASFEAMMEKIDSLTHHAKMAKNFFLAGGGTITFNPSSGLLTWTDDFVIPVFHYGYLVKIKYGSDNTTRSQIVLNGNALVVDIPYALQENKDVNLIATSQLTPLSDSQFVIGWRYGSTLYLRNLGNF